MTTEFPPLDKPHHSFKKGTSDPRSQRERLDEQARQIELAFAVHLLDGRDADQVGIPILGDQDEPFLDHRRRYRQGNRRPPHEFGVIAPMRLGADT